MRSELSRKIKKEELGHIEDRSTSPRDPASEIDVCKLKIIEMQQLSVEYENSNEYRKIFSKLLHVNARLAKITSDEAVIKDKIVQLQKEILNFEDILVKKYDQIEEASPQGTDNPVANRNFIKPSKQIPERKINVMLDEIYVNSDISNKGGKIEGFSVNTDNDSNKPATTIQTFMLRSILSKNKDIIGFFPVQRLTAAHLHELIMKSKTALQNSNNLNWLCSSYKNTPVPVISTEPTLSDIMQAINLFKLSIQFCSNKIDDFEKKMNGYSEKIKLIEPTTEKCDTIQIKVEDIEKRSRANNIELVGMPEKQNENLLQLVTTVKQVVSELSERNMFKTNEHVTYAEKTKTPKRKEKSVLLVKASGYTKGE
ncbi:hypothetical protein CBL_05078 [Carabus blaptoides fortunei]